jgi:hypothetical protein
MIVLTVACFIGGQSDPEAIGFWASKEHEIDFVTPDRDFIEVKRGKASPMDFSWFSRIFPRDHQRSFADRRSHQSK